MLKKIVLAIMLALPMIASAQGVKIGLVDTNTILTSLPDTKTAQDKINALSKDFQDQDSKFIAALQKKMEDYQALPETTPQATKDALAKEIQADQQKIVEFEQNAQNEMQKAQEREMAPVINKVRDAIQAVGKEGNYTIVQELGAVLYYGAPAEDITPAVKAKLGIK